jgi:hypothetical protein
MECEGDGMAAELSRGHITKILAHLFILAADVCVCVCVWRERVTI